MFLYLAKTRVNGKPLFAYYIPMKFGDWTLYVKFYTKVKGLSKPTPVHGVSGCMTNGLEERYYVTIDADKKKLPREMVEASEVVYYRRYRSNGVVKEHLIMGPPTTKSKSIRLALGYDDNKHLKAKHYLPCWAWGVIRITPLQHEETLDVFINKKDPLGKLISLLLT